MKALILKPPLGNKTNVVSDFIYGCWCNGRRIGGMQMPPLNDLYVTTYARKNGLDVDFVDGQVQPELYKAYEDKLFSNIKAIAILSSTHSFQSDVELLTHIKKKNNNVTCILFGAHPTFMPESCLQHPAVDFIVLREAEESMFHLLKHLLNDTPLDDRGIGRKGPNDEIVIAPPRPFVDMDTLPIPDRTLLPKNVDYFNPVVRNTPYTTMQTSRGCPWKCIFCTAPEFYGKQVRFRSPEDVLYEIELLNSLGYREIFFRDETFTTDRNRIIKICKMLIDRKLKISWIANARSNTVDLELLKIMKQAGCHLIKFGVESGSDKMLARYKKNITTQQTKNAFELCHSVGLDTHAHIVLGGPGETRESIEKTLRFTIELKPSTASFGILTPYPGSPLFETVSKAHPNIGDGSNATLEKLHVKGFFSEALCGISSQELSESVSHCYRKFYLRPTYIFTRLSKIRSFSEIVPLFIAGCNILHFSITGEK